MRAIFEWILEALPVFRNPRNWLAWELYWMSGDNAAVAIKIQPKIAEIPEGCYCYGNTKYDPETGKLHVKPCPFIATSKLHYKHLGDQSSGYCKLSGDKDWGSGVGLLWDSCKTCGINEGDFE